MSEIMLVKKVTFGLAIQGLRHREAAIHREKVLGGNDFCQHATIIEEDSINPN
jgi:hypothetical protein